MKNYGVLVLLGMLVWLSSCENDAITDASPINLIPATAEMVFAINPQQMLDKGDFKAFQQKEFYQEMVEEIAPDDPVIASILKDPAEAGIDLTQHMFMAIDYSETDGDDSLFAGWYLALADVEKFETLLNAVEFDITPAANFQYIQPTNKAVLGWNENFAVFGFGADDDLAPEQINALLATDGPTLAQNANIQKWLAKDFDMAHWLRGTAITAEMQAELLTDFVLDRDQLANSYIHTSALFKNGEVTGKSDFYLDRGIKADLDLLFKNKVKTDFTTIFPSDSIVGMLTAGFSVQGANQLLIEKYSKGIADQGLRAFGIKIEDLIKALDGDVAQAAYQFDNDFHILAGLKIGDQSALDTIITKLIKADLLVKEGNHRYTLNEEHANYIHEKMADSTRIDTIIEMRPNAYILIDNDILLVSNTTDLLDIIEGGDYPTKGAIHDRINTLSKDHIFSAYFPINEMMKFERKSTENWPIEIMEAKANRKSIDAVLKFKDEDVNSLKQILQFMDAERAKASGKQKKI